jgi:hypothetical protein
MDTTESSAPHAHPSTDDHDDTIEAHYASLERLRHHACMGGWVLVGYIDVIRAGISFRAPASIMLPLAAPFSPHRTRRGLHFAWLCLARNFRRCDHVYPRWGGHNVLVSMFTSPPVLGAPASLIRSELPQPHRRGSDPSLCPAPPMLQGVSYVQGSGLGAYVRNLVPVGI